MFNQIINNIDEHQFKFKDFKYLFSSRNNSEENKIYAISQQIQENNFNKTRYEYDIFYPTLFQIEDNCPTCGYRTKESRLKYSEEYIARSVEYKLDIIGKYNISGVNCINKGITGIRELMIIMGCLEKLNLDVNVRVSDNKHLKYLRRYDLNSIIFQSSLNKLCFNKIYHESNIAYEEKVLKYIKENMNLNSTYEFLINSGEDENDIFNKILEIEKYDFDTIWIEGYDPFIDSPEEYNPQYSKEYIIKIISLLRIYFPTKEIKIRYATNGNNYLEEYKKYGINTISTSKAIDNIK